MAKDYAKQSTKNKKSKKRARNSSPNRTQVKHSPPWMWLATGLAIGLMVAGLVILKLKAPVHSNQLTQPTRIAPLKPKLARLHKTQPKPQGPIFDFYTILPKIKVATSPNATTPQKQIQNNPNQFILQVAAFKKHKDADRMKAELALLGFEASINKITSNKQKWYRVWLGPYASRGTAQQTQGRLRQDKIDSLLRNA